MSKSQRLDLLRRGIGLIRQATSLSFCGDVELAETFLCHALGPWYEAPFANA